MTEKNGTIMMQPATNMQTFNFFDPVQFDTMQRVCNFFAYSELVPDMYKAVFKPIPANANDETKAAIQAENTMIKTKAIANCMIATSIAVRINADPLMVMQNMAIIHGKPSWSSKFLIATVNTCGRFEPLQYKFTTNGKIGKIKYVEYIWNDRTRRKEAITKEFDGSQIDNLSCFAFTTKKGSSDILKSTVVDLKLAVLEGWYTKAGSKWPTMPELMLTYRAASFWTNTYAPELSMGMRTIEENQDVEDAEYVEIKENDQTVDNMKKIAANAGKIDMGSAPVAEAKTEQPVQEKPVEEEPKAAEVKTDDNTPSWA